MPAVLDETHTVKTAGLIVPVAKAIFALMRTFDSAQIATRMEMPEADVVRYMHCIRESRRRHMAKQNGAA